MPAKKIGRYEVKGELGRGGMATVFLAHDPLIGRDVAVKVLPREFLHDPSFRGRFQREARTIAMLEHPAIVPIYDFGEQDGQPYLVMRYMKGGTLGSRVEKGSMPLPQAAEILRRLASALDHAHQRGVVHRDLKPGNILFDEYGRAFLSDFGIVKLAQATATFTGESIIGTPAYMSPEQVHGDKEIDGRSDIYTLGIILFEMLTGQMPYRADTPAKLMMAHVLNPVPRILDARPDLPEGCNGVVNRALAKDPDDRFSTAGSLSKAFTDTMKRPAPDAGSTVLDSAPQKEKTKERVRDPGQAVAVPRDETPPPAAQEAPGEKSGRSRFWLAGIGLLAVLGLCCGALVIFPLLTGNSLFGGNTPTATVDTVIQTGSETPEGVTGQEVATEGDEIDPEATSRSATSTAEAQAAAIATRVAESTRTAEEREAATATAYAPTRAVEEAIQAVLVAQENDPLFGPGSGSLVHVPDGFVKAEYAGVDVSDFVVDALFHNPYAATAGGWDIGFSFREADFNDQYRLAVESNGEWSLANRLGEDLTYIDSGTLTNLNDGEGDSNRMTLYANGDVGHFFFNGRYLTRLDLSTRTVSGDIGVATSMFTGNEIEGEETGFESFTVWPLP